MHRALVCLVQDFLASEMKCENARNVAVRGLSGSSSQNAVQALGSESSGASVESELEARANGRSTITAEQFNEGTENLAKALAKLHEEKLAAAAASGFASSSTSGFGGTWGMPKVVEVSNMAHVYIEGWVDMIKPGPVSSTKISEEKRQQRLRDM